MQNETEYKKSKGLHKTIQAGVFHCGEPFAYLNENWPNATIMPPCIRELKDIAGERTGKKYDIALFKVCVQSVGHSHQRRRSPSISA